MKRLVFTVVLSFVLTIILSERTAAQDLACSGSVASVTVDNVNVAPGASCVLVGTQIRGDIKVGQGGSLNARNVRVNGSVQADLANRIVVRSGSRILGSVQIKKSNIVTISRSTIIGDVQLEENTGTQTVSFSSITGELSASKNSGAVNFLSNIRVGVDIVAEENGARAVTFRDNRTNGNLQLSKNRGGVTVTDNFAKGNLQCVENTPFLSQIGNTVGGTLQCANYSAFGASGFSAPYSIAPIQMHEASDLVVRLLDLLVPRPNDTLDELLL